MVSYTKENYSAISHFLGGAHGMGSDKIFHITNLTLNDHFFREYHFCRGNNSKRKSRIGLVEAGHANFMYLNRKIEVKQGDVIFIPGKIFCYSEWFGSPDIRVFYLSFDVECDEEEGAFELQSLPVEREETRQLLRRIRELLQGDLPQTLEAYSLFYHFLAQSLPRLDSKRQKLDSRLHTAIDYITRNWNRDFSMADLAQECLLSESHLYHLFKTYLGQTPVNYLNAVKVNYAIQYLENEQASIAEICAMTNFHSESYFRRVFRAATGITPSDYRKALHRG